MKWRTPARVVSIDAPFLARIRAIKAESPFWGYRAGWAYMLSWKLDIGETLSEKTRK